MEYDVFYANGIGVALSNDDCCITLKTLVPNEAEGCNTRNKVSKGINVMMTIDTAKRLAEGLQKSFVDLEKAKQLSNKNQDLENKLKVPNKNGQTHKKQ